MSDSDRALTDHDSSQAGMMVEACLCLDENDTVIDTASKLQTHLGEGMRHRAFSVLIYDLNGRLLVQKRASEKITFPSVWANSCCSHPLDIAGENGEAVDCLLYTSDAADDLH